MLPKPFQFRLAGAAVLAVAFPLMSVQAQDGGKDPVGLGPVETHDYMRDAVIEGRIGDVFRALPKSYQKDVNGLFSKFATKMDPDLWDGVVGLLGSISNILNTQKEVIVGSETFDQLDPEAQRGVTESWDQAAELFGAFTESDILDLGEWKKGDMGGLLDGPGAEMFKGLSAMEIPDQGGATFGDMLALGGEAKAELVSEEGGRAVLKTTNPGGDVQEVEMVRVQKRWVPAEMADVWESNIAEANAGLDQMDFDSPEFAEQKMIMMMGMGAAKNMLKQVEEAKTSADFDRTVKSMAKMLESFGG